jgi:hypothetical protein
MTNLILANHDSEFRINYVDLLNKPCSEEHLKPQYKFDDGIEQVRREVRHYPDCLQSEMITGHGRFLYHAFQLAVHNHSLQIS